MSGYYGVRRAFLSDPDFHNTKQFANDACTSSAAKPFACESSAGQGHAALLDPYFPEPYGDHRPTALTPNSGTLFSASALPPLLPPPFPSDPAHFALVSTQRLSLGGVTEVGFPQPWTARAPSSQGSTRPGRSQNPRSESLPRGFGPATREEALCIQGLRRDD